MKIYIASSWKNQHAVELLTAVLRRRGHEIASFVEKAVDAESRCLHGKFDIDKWIESEDGARKFDYDTINAMTSDLVIYISPSGIDAWAEVGAAWAKGVQIVGLYAKGEQAGLMRRMVDWTNSTAELLGVIDEVTAKLTRSRPNETDRNRMTPAENILEILSSHRALPPGRKGIYSDELARLAGCVPGKLRKYIRRARKKLPAGKRIAAYQTRWGTEWHLVREMDTRKQVELFERKIA